jgi:nucleoside-diphosphate-sugar epimerase
VWWAGSHIVEALLARGEEDVQIFDAVDSHLFKDEPNVLLHTLSGWLAVSEADNHLTCSSMV